MLCWWESAGGPPAAGLLAGSGGFGFRIMDFEFVGDFEIGISNFLFGGGRRPR